MSISRIDPSRSAPINYADPLWGKSKTAPKATLEAVAPQPKATIGTARPATVTTQEATTPSIPADPTETTSEKQDRLQDSIGTIKEALQARPSIGLVVPDLLGPKQPLSLKQLKTVNSTLDSVNDPRDRSFIISQLSDQELRTLGSGTGKLSVGPFLPKVPSGQGAEFDAEYKTLFTKLGGSVDGYQADRVLKQLPEQRQDAFVDTCMKNASPQYRQEFAEAAVADPSLSADRKLYVLHSAYAAATPQQRGGLLRSPTLHQFAERYLADHADRTLTGPAVGAGPLAAEDLFRGDRVGLRQSASQQEAEILLGDKSIGAGHIDTPFEHKLLKKWLYGNGSPYVLSGAELGVVKTNPDVQAIGSAIAGGQVPKDGVQLPDGSHVKPRSVTLADGTKGYVADMSFTMQRNELDGSIGKGRVYFDSEGRPVGIRDTYDFSNDNITVDATNLVGSSIGAKNFLVTGGLVETTPLDVPSDPSVASSITELANDIPPRVVDKVEAGVGWVGDKAGDGVSWAGDKLRDGAGRVIGFLS